MKINMGWFDRVVRLALAVVLGITVFTNAITGVLAVVMSVIGLILLVTSILGFCPLYALLHISTGHGRSHES